MSHLIYITTDMIYIMGRTCYDDKGDFKEDWIENPLILTLMEDNIVHFMSYDIFNKDKKIKISSYITKYEPLDSLVEKYENLINGINDSDINTSEAIPTLKLIDFEKGDDKNDT